MALEIERMSLEELFALHKRVVRRIEYLQSLKTATELNQFAVGDRVSFQSDGRALEGVVVRVNRKTLSVRTEDSHWTIHPRFLTKRSSQGSGAPLPQADAIYGSWN